MDPAAVQCSPLCLCDCPWRPPGLHLLPNRAQHKLGQRHYECVRRDLGRYGLIITILLDGRVYQLNLLPCYILCAIAQSNTSCRHPGRPLPLLDLYRLL